MLRAANVLENTIELANGAGFRAAPAQHFFLERYEAAYRAEMLHFIEALNAGQAVSPGIDDGLRAQLLADAATLSCAENRVVTLP
jgi:myo-inositol 2-dehydrogenase/D-chiro-inositol 1-dehydrogenase